MNKEAVYLVQADTTVGFSSNNDEKLSTAKQRPKNQKILQTVDSFQTLKEKTRIPNKHKNRVRRASKTTFIYPNNYSFRIIDDKDKFHMFIKKFGCLYSTSANKTKESFDFEYAVDKSDIMVFNGEGFSEKSASFIYKLSKNKLKKIR